MAKAPLEIRSLARKHTESALRTLAQIMGQPKAPPSARVAAASALLDRGWGKPTQTIDQTIKDERPVADLTVAELTERASDTLARIDELTAGVSGQGAGKERPTDLRQLN